MKMLKEFWAEEEGIATVDVLLVLAVLIIIAILFRKTIIDWVNKMLANVFDAADQGMIGNNDLTPQPTK